jgi:hypothetical protein
VRSIKLESRSTEDWSGKFLDDSSYDLLLDESARVYKPDGSLLLALFKAGHSKAAVTSAWSVLKDYNPSTNNRGIAAGSERRKRIRADGTESNTNIADPVNSGIVGFFERSPRFPYCRACAWNLEHPELFENLVPVCREASEFYRQCGEEKFAKQERHAHATHPDFLIPGTVFSTLTVNKNFRTACHKDAGNLQGTLNVMSLFREGIFTGGHIVLPDFRVAAKLETGDCIVFDAHEFHGNTPIFQISKKFTRCTVVFYYRENMDRCGSAAAELERAKRRQLGEPMFDEPAK